MDVSRFQGLLTSLADISHWRFEVWEGKSPVFATGSEDGSQLAEREALAQAIMDRGDFQQVSQGNNGFLAGLPLKSEGAPVGALLAWTNGAAAPFLPSDKTAEAFLGRLTGVIQDSWAAKTEAEKMTEELSRNYEDIYLFARISSWVKCMHFSETMLEDLIGEILDTLRADLVFVQLGENQGGRKIAQTDSFTDRITDAGSFIDSLLAALPEKAVSFEENYYVVNDSRNEPGYGKLHPEPFRALLVMVKDGEKFYGWFGVLSFNLNDIFRRSQLRLMSSIAEQAAVVITNTDLYQELERFSLDMVKSLVLAIEAKDTYTRGHSERVSKYSLLIAERLNMDNDEKIHLNWAAILHDVGKIGISEAILTKPGRLTEEEYNLIQTHPAKGYYILKPLKPLSGSLTGILHHHERLNGKGYPDGLRGEEIPLMARIIAVADTFDAINSDRAYRPGRSATESMAIMESVAGSELDADLVQILASIIAEENKERTAA